MWEKSVLYVEVDFLIEQIQNSDSIDLSVMKTYTL
jgi:hypothetical protein